MRLLLATLLLCGVLGQGVLTQELAPEPPKPATSTPLNREKAPTPSEHARAIAETVQKDFGCVGRKCLDIALTYGGAKNQIPEKYRELMNKKLTALGPSSDKEGRAVAGIVAVFGGACMWDEVDCKTVLISSAHRHKSGMGSARHTNQFGTRAFDLVGFSDIDHQIRFLTRMAIVAESMGLRPNVGLGRVEVRYRVNKGKWATHTYQSTHFDVNGHEISHSRKGHSKGGGIIWTYGPLNALQSTFHTIIGTGKDLSNFADRILRVR